MFSIEIEKKSNNKVLRISFLTRIFLICNFFRKLSFTLLDITNNIELDKTILNISTILAKQIENLFFLFLINN